MPVRPRWTASNWGFRLLGDIWLKYQVAVFSRMLSTLLSGGLPLVPRWRPPSESMQSRLMSQGYPRIDAGRS